MKIFLFTLLTSLVLILGCSDNETTLPDKETTENKSNYNEKSAEESAIDKVTKTNIPANDNIKSMPTQTPVPIPEYNPIVKKSEDYPDSIKDAIKDAIPFKTGLPENSICSELNEFSLDKRTIDDVNFGNWVLEDYEIIPLVGKLAIKLIHPKKKTIIFDDLPKVDGVQKDFKYTYFDLSEKEYLEDIKILFALERCFGVVALVETDLLGEHLAASDYEDYIGICKSKKNFKFCYEDFDEYIQRKYTNEREYRISRLPPPPSLYQCIKENENASMKTYARVFSLTTVNSCKEEAAPEESLYLECLLENMAYSDPKNYSGIYDSDEKYISFTTNRICDLRHVNRNLQGVDSLDDLIFENTFYFVMRNSNFYWINQDWVYDGSEHIGLMSEADNNFNPSKKIKLADPFWSLIEKPEKDYGGEASSICVDGDGGIELGIIDSEGYEIKAGEINNEIFSQALHYYLKDLHLPDTSYPPKKELAFDMEGNLVTNPPSPFDSFMSRSWDTDPENKSFVSLVTTNCISRHHPIFITTDVDGLLDDLEFMVREHIILDRKLRTDTTGKYFEWIE